ncbi:hypothetical protein [Methylobacterium durans]|uniref:ArsR family transcriptional regulator n=1 Tax=Methylobacterium durans TaxID=2202825 RepID=A0A2U8WEI1_9HYPH|nr:hypothetical protein [Methylobacterium durans]AWN43736.1 hypothetical protein DK389_28500 [Methylobacterium durans]
MLINHERRLLRQAAEADDRQISIKQKPDRTWPGDHSRLLALESRGDLRSVGLESGGAFATWRITETGLSALERLSGLGA